MESSEEKISSRMVYAIVSNIPHDYHSKHLRDYFSMFLETGGFDCFHFRHRPETKTHQTSSDLDLEKEDDTSGSGNTTTAVQLGAPVGPNAPQRWTKELEKRKIQKKTTCCIVRLKEEKLSELLKLYHRKHWLDKQGDSIPQLCFIAKVKLTQNEGSSCDKYKTRKEQRQIPENREQFTMSDLNQLAELHPPDIMPNGNVGTPTKHFLTLIKECRLPPVVIKKLGLSFPKTRSKRKYGNVPLEYDGEVFEGTAGDEITVTSAGGKELQSETEFISQIQKDEQTDTNQRDKKRKNRKHKNGASTSQGQLPSHNSDSEHDNDSCEEWERHEALHDDPWDVERNKERLFEEEIELKWEKGGSGLVFYTDAQYWDEKEGDFDERTADDWDVDMSVYYDPDGGDKDGRDYITMRREQRLRNGEEDDTPSPRKRRKDSDLNSDKIGKFEKHSKGFGRKIMERQGWKEGQGLGSSIEGMADALENDGQNPKDKSGIGYHGEKLVRTGFKRPRTDSNVIISTVYDKPQETDPQEPLLRRNETTHLKWRNEIRFKKATDDG